MAQQQTLARDDEAGARALRNSRHDRLAREYAAGASQAEAWRMAFGRDPKSGNASRTFRRPEIAARVEYLRAEACRLAGISLAALQARLLRIADADAVRLFESDENGRLCLRDLTRLPREVTAPISSIEITDRGGVKVKLADRLHAIDSLIRTIGGFAPDQHDHSHSVSLEALVLGSMALRAQDAVKANPGKPDAAIAEQIHVDQETITRARKRLTGGDGADPENYDATTAKPAPAALAVYRI